MQERRKLFDDFVEACNKNNFIIGQGNPLSNILFVGCEPNFKGVDPDKMHAEYIKKYQTHTEECLCSKNGKTFDNLCGFHDKKEHGEGWTWNKYQKIIDEVYPNRPHEQGMLDFEEMAFCTELNNVCASKSKDASKTTIPLKRQLFKESDFIQSFPVVILACGSYIINQGENRQIDDTFGVHFVKPGMVNAKQNYWIHESNDSNNPKLVIHTRQLSGATTNELLESIGSTIRGFLKTIGRLE